MEIIICKMDYQNLGNLNQRDCVFTVTLFEWNLGRVNGSSL